MSPQPSELLASAQAAGAPSQVRVGGMPKDSEGLSLTDRVYLAIKDDIALVRLAPGESIIEPALSERFGVSKTPVREALRLLAHEDLVLILPRKGYVVRPLGFQDIVEVFSLRLLLQPQVFGQAALRRLPHQIHRLHELSAAFQDAPDWASEVVRGMALNLYVAEIAGPSRGARILQGLFLESQRFWLLTRQVPGTEEWTKQDDDRYNAALIDAIERGDASAARQVTAEYVTVLQSHVLAGLAPVGS